jgi:hypothetical protein
MNTRNNFQRGLFIILLSTIIPLAGIAKGSTTLFPEVKGWKVNVGDKVYTPETLWDLINGAADAYLSYDFKNLHTAEYTNEKGHTVKVYAFKHSTPRNAFGIYSQERNPDYEFLDIGSQGFKSPGALYFIKGSYYIQLSTNDKPMYDKLDPLARNIDKALDVEAGLPKTLSLFPEEGKTDYSERYIAGDFMGRSYLHSAFTAEYKSGGNEFQIFIIAPEDEKAVKNMLSKYLDSQDYPENKRDKSVYRIETKYSGSILLYNTGKYLCGIKQADKKTEDKYLKMLKEKLG